MTGNDGWTFTDSSALYDVLWRNIRATSKGRTRVVRVLAAGMDQAESISFSLLGSGKEDYAHEATRLVIE